VRNCIDPFLVFFGLFWVFFHFWGVFFGGFGGVFWVFFGFLGMVASGRSQLLIPGFRHAHTLHQPKCMNGDVYSSPFILLIGGVTCLLSTNVKVDLLLHDTFSKHSPGGECPKTFLGWCSVWAWRKPGIKHPGYGQRPHSSRNPSEFPHENPRNPPPQKYPTIYIYIKRVYGLGDLGGSKGLGF